MISPRAAYNGIIMCYWVDGKRKKAYKWWCKKHSWAQAEFGSSSWDYRKDSADMLVARFCQVNSKNLISDSTRRFAFALRCVIHPLNCGFAERPHPWQPLLLMREGQYWMKNLASLKQCDTCKAMNCKLWTCRRCRSVHYCSKRCQKWGWKRCGHKYICRKRETRQLSIHWRDTRG